MRETDADPAISIEATTVNNNCNNNINAISLTPIPKIELLRKSFREKIFAFAKDKSLEIFTVNKQLVWLGFLTGVPWIPEWLVERI